MKTIQILCCSLLLAFAVQVGAAVPRYFVVADHPMDAQGRLLEFGSSTYDSCLVPISDTNDIAYARLLYQRNNPSRYPNAEGLLGPLPKWACEVVLEPFRTYNLDYMAPSAGLWNWTVSRLQSFQAGFTYVGFHPTQLIDHVSGGMSRVEEDFDQIATENNGVFRFGYALSGELPIQPTAFLPNGWKKSDWLGVFYDASYPWIYSEALGWLYLVPGKFDPFDIWMYSSKPGLGWVWTSEDVYPQAWHPGRSEWLDLSDYDK